MNAFGKSEMLPAIETNRPGDEGRAAKQAIAHGASVIVVVGGDGSCGRVADVILQSGSECALAVVPCGTGNDFAKTLGVQTLTPLQVAQLVSRGGVARIDVGLVDGHYFLNSCGFGFDASVLAASNRVRFLRGDAVYIYAALRQLFTYRATEVAVIGARGVSRAPMLMVTVSNGRFLGGVFNVAPNASVLDGRLDACFFGDSNVVERVRLFVGAIRGTHLGMRSVTADSVQRLALTFATRPSMEMDGELREARSTTVELICVPRALSVIAAAGYPR